MSIASSSLRPLARLTRLGLPLRQSSTLTASSSVPTAPNAPPPNSASTSSSSSTSSTEPTLPIPPSPYFTTPVPRSPYFPTHFPENPYHQHVNYPYRLFQPPKPDEFPQVLGENVAAKNESLLGAVTGLGREGIRRLNRYGVVLKRVVHMTKKGKQPSWMAIVVVGSPERGLVGIGRGRGANVAGAMDQGFHKAVLSMDYVNKFENRTLWGSGSDLKSKWGSTTVIMRARPPGFGLQVPHALHRLFTACGIRDASATIEGSRNPVSVLKCGIQILHGGYGPPGLGSGTGKPGRREDKGAGMRSVQDIERERGRRGVDVGKRM